QQCGAERGEDSGSGIHGREAPGGWWLFKPTPDHRPGHPSGGGPAKGLIRPATAAATPRSGKRKPALVAVEVSGESRTKLVPATGRLTSQRPTDKSTLGRVRFLPCPQWIDATYALSLSAGV